MKEEGPMQLMAESLKVASSASLWLASLPIRAGMGLATRSKNIGQSVVTEIQDPFQNHPETRRHGRSDGFAEQTSPDRRRPTRKHVRRPTHHTRRVGPALKVVRDSHLGQSHD
jgi:hypothetical protein